MTSLERTTSLKSPARLMNVLFVFLVTLAFTPLTQAQSDGAAAELPQVRMHTSEGVLELTLRSDLAPQTVANFLTYVDNGFYDGTVFHRVIPGFMIQGGGFTADLLRKQTREPVRNEGRAELPNQRGTIAMARTSDPHSATSQFFINLVDNQYLNAGARGAGYAVFGKVTSGMDVADAIAGKRTGRRNGMGDVPLDTVTIEKIVRIGEAAE